MIKTNVFMSRASLFGSYNLTLFSSFTAAVARVGVADADGVGVDTAVFLFRFAMLLLILSEPGLLGGDSLTVGTMVLIGTVPLMLLKCPMVDDVGP